MKRIVACAAAAVLSLATPLPPVRAQPPAALVAPASAQELSRLPFNYQSPIPDDNAGLLAFGAKAFPQLDYLSHADAEKIVGPYTLTTRYFDRNHKEVKEASNTGRYGAIVEVRDASGQVRDTRFVTLYRKPSQRFGTVDGSGDGLPEGMRETGVSEAQITAQYPALVEYRRKDVAPQNALSYAVLLAGVSESHGGDAPIQRLSVRERDRRWWYEQKKRLGMSGVYRHIVETPASYAIDGKKYPVLLFLHGSGERGLNVEQVRVHGPLRYIREGHELPFIVVAPQCEPGDRWLPERVMDLLSDVEKRYRVDKSRIYLTGLSMGGYGTWATALEYPNRFAALLPICGAGDPLDAARIKDKPIWNFHGGADPTVPVERSIEMVSALRALDAPELYFKVYPGVGHDSWTQTYNNPDIYTWLLQHRLD